jgi:hypothetical protein
MKSNRGTLIKSFTEKQSLGITIESFFHYGILHGPTKFSYPNRSSEQFEYKLNLKLENLRPFKKEDLQFGIYDFVEEE